MNIAIFASAFYPSLGGVEELVRQLAHQQRSRGQQPLIVTNRWPKTLPAEDTYEGLDVRRYVFRVPERTAKQMGGCLLYRGSTLRRVCADLRMRSIDLIHVQCVSSNAYYALLAHRRLKLPLVVTLQGELSMDATGLFQRSHFARNLMRTVLKEADAITACSAQTLAEAEAFYGKPFGERGRVIYNGIRLADFDKAAPYEHARPYIFAIGRHVPQKGFDVLLRAFAQMAHSGENTHDLLLAGDGAEQENLKQLANQLNISSRVRFTGRVDRADTARLFAGCAFFVLPSRHEPMGIVNLEAMAAGKAVIASCVGGVPELIRNNDNGLLVPPADVDALAEALACLVNDRVRRETMGHSGHTFAQQFDWNLIAAQYDEVYTQALHDSPFSRVPRRKV